MIVDSNFILSSLALANYPTGGVIGTASETVDIASSFMVSQNTVGQVLTAPTPTDATAGLFITVINTGLASFVIYENTVQPGSYVTLFWDGSSWYKESGQPPVILPPTGGNLDNFVTLTNSSSLTIVKGTPVYSLGGSFLPAIANDPNVKRIVGLTTSTVLPSALGQIQIDGILQFTNAEWQSVTGMPGGISNSSYWVSSTQEGMLTPFPVQQTHPEVWALKLGYGVDSTNFKIEIHPSVKL